MTPGHQITNPARPCPCGIAPSDQIINHKCPDLLSIPQPPRRRLRCWWLQVPSGRALVPNRPPKVPLTNIPCSIRQCLITVCPKCQRTLQKITSPNLATYCRDTTRSAPQMAIQFALSSVGAASLHSPKVSATTHRNPTTDCRIRVSSVPIRGQIQPHGSGLDPHLAACRDHPSPQTPKITPLSQPRPTG